MLFFKFFFSIFMLCMLTTCSPKPAPNHPKRQVLRLNIPEAPKHLDWNQGSDDASRLVLSLIMDPLLEAQTIDNQLRFIPKVAKSWTFSDDFKSLILYLRNDVKWHDGVNLTADHCIESFRRLLDVTTLSNPSPLFLSIKKAREFRSGKTTFDSVGIKPLDSYSIQFNFETPTPSFLEALSTFDAMPIRRDLILKNKDKWTQTGKLVGLGAYVLRAWDQEEVRQGTLQFERNMHYFGGNASIPSIHLHIIPDPGSALTMYETGQLDILLQIPHSERARLLKLFPQELIQTPRISTVFLAFPSAKKPFQDQKVRAALQLAIDRNELTQLAGPQKRATSLLFTALLTGLDETGTLQAEVAKAKNMLNQVNVDLAIRLPKIHLVSTVADPLKNTGLNIQAQWAKNLGLKTEIEITPRSFHQIMEQETSESSITRVYLLRWSLKEWAPSQLHQSIQEVALKLGYKPKTPKQKLTTLTQDLLAHLEVDTVREEQIFFPLYTDLQEIMVKPYVKGLRMEGTHTVALHTLRIE